jgi:type I restriction enzyme S subunit
VDNITDGTKTGDHLKNLAYTPLDVIPMRKMSFWGGQPYTEALSSLLLYKEDDILLGAMRVHFHRVCISAQSGITRSTTIVMRCKNHKKTPFIYQVINTEEAIAYAAKLSGKSQQPYVNWDDEFENYSFPLPPEDLVNQYAEKMSPLIEQVKRNEKENKELTALRDFLLPLLIDGQVTVKTNNIPNKGE